MSRYTGPKNRIARQFGANIFGRARNPLLRKSNAPGVHGARRKKKSDFGAAMVEKQKLKAIYGMLREKQLINYYHEAVERHGHTANNLIALLESRLDMVVYRLKLAPTIFAAQQLVAHGHVLVNGKKVDIRSYQVKPGHTISLKEKAHKLPIVASALASAREVASHLVLDAEKFSGQMLSEPAAESVSFPLEVNVPVICDFLANQS